MQHWTQDTEQRQTKPKKHNTETEKKLVKRTPPKKKTKNKKQKTKQNKTKQTDKQN